MIITQRQQKAVIFDRPTIGIVALFLIGAALIASIIIRQPPTFSSGILHAKGGRYSLTLEVASTSRQRRNGLMKRDTLASNSGMLFVYDEEQAGDHTFWMYQTRIPLDIAFLNHEGEIQSIFSMAPCTTDKEACPQYPAGARFWMAVEVNAGYFNEHGIAVGDRLEIDSWRPPVKSFTTPGMTEEHNRFLSSKPEQVGPI